MVALHQRPEAFDERWTLDPTQVRPFVYDGRGRYQAFGDAQATDHRVEA